jgi:antitoxin CcdA
MRIKETEMLPNHQSKRPFNLTLNEATVEQARRYTNNLSATVDGLLADFVARESTERQDKQQLRDDVCDALNQFNAVYGSFADEYSTL